METFWLYLYLEVQESTCWHLWHEISWINMYDFLHSHDKYLCLSCFGLMFDLRDTDSPKLLTCRPAFHSHHDYLYDHSWLGCWSNMHMQIFAYLWIVKSNIWPWSWGIRYFEKLLKQLTPCNMYTVQVRRKKDTLHFFLFAFIQWLVALISWFFFHFQMKHVI